MNRSSTLRRRPSFTNGNVQHSGSACSEMRALIESWRAAMVETGWTA